MIEKFNAPSSASNAPHRQRFRAHFSLALILAATASLCLTRPAAAYVDLAPNLSKVISDSARITEVEVVNFDHEKNHVTLKEIKTLKGEASDQSPPTIVHEVVSAPGAAVPRPILEWAVPGARAVIFVAGKVAMVCYGKGWYQAQEITPHSWKLGMERPDLPLAYYGTVPRLVEGIQRMLAGKDAVLTVVPHGADEAASFDLALNRMALPGLIKVQRIRANLSMPGLVMAVSTNPAYLIGQGPVGENDLPELLKKLQSANASVRAAAAEDIGSLGVTGVLPAEKPLTALLADQDARARMAAAAALLRGGNDTSALAVLSDGLKSKDATNRRLAAGAVSYSGKNAGPLTPELASLLNDSDAATRIAALEAIAVLGPAAKDAAPAVKKLLADPALQIDAADALGRIGTAAQPVPDAMVKMLDSDQPPVRWAAIRGMSQIGGKEAHPAVDFMIKALPTAGEVDNYNMHIYLALLGPVAKDAVNAIRNAHLKNPILPTATIWAIDPTQGFPWQMGGRGFMGGGMRGGNGPDISKFIYEAYISELGDRLKPAGAKLCKAILAGTAGDVPEWGYKLLDCDLENSLSALESRLADPNVVMRERAAVALGYMGTAAAPAKPKLESAIANAQSEKEKKILQWSLRQISKAKQNP